MSARDELAAVVYKARWVDGIRDVNLMTDSAIADAILAAGYRKPEVIVEWAAAHQSNGVVYNLHRTRDDAQAFVDSMAEVDHPMVVKRREHTPATYTAWELQP